LLHVGSIHGDTPSPHRAVRILVSRTRPADLSHTRIDRWIPEIAPTEWLEHRFGRHPVRWGTFRSRYRRQLRSKKRRRLLEEIAALSRRSSVVLLSDTKDGDRAPAEVVAEVLCTDFGCSLRA